MLKVSYKTIKEEGIDVLFDAYKIDHQRNDPYNHIFATPLEKRLEDPRHFKAFIEFIDGYKTITLNQKNPSIEDITAYCISKWVCARINWVLLYGDDGRKVAFNDCDGTRYYPKGFTKPEENVLLTYRGSKLLANIIPYIKRRIKDKRLVVVNKA